MTRQILVARDGIVVGAMGWPGGSSSPGCIAKTLVGLVYWDLPLQQAVDLPNLVARGNRFTGEASRFSPRIRDELTRRGLAVRSGSGEATGLHGVLLRDGVPGVEADRKRLGKGQLGQSRVN